MRINNKGVAISVLVVLFVALGGLSVYVFARDDNMDTSSVLAQSQFKDPATGVSFSYPSDLRLEELTQEDIDDNFVARLTSQEPPIIISVRYEDGIEPITGITGQDTLELITSNAIKALPTRFPGFELRSERATTIANKNASDIVFSYDGPSGEQATQRLVIIETTRDLAIYLSFQATAKDFNFANSTYFSPISDSVQLN